MIRRARTDIVIIFISLIVGAFTCWGVFKYVAVPLNEGASAYMAQGVFCSQDGVNWWRARPDNSCWATDKPEVTLIPPIKVRTAAPVASVEEPR